MIDHNSQQQRASSAAIELARALFSKHIKVVFAESCTAGLVSATLAQVPGISNQLCGSVVTYRETTKQEWLGIPRDVITAHSPESQIVTDLMATQVLSKTSEADYSAAVTGHLGPNAPQNKDGIVFVSVARRIEEQIVLDASTQFRLTSHERVSRQLESTMLVFKQLLAAIE